jgi:hypothetical protein
MQHQGPAFGITLELITGLTAAALLDGGLA